MIHLFYHADDEIAERYDEDVEVVVMGAFSGDYWLFRDLKEKISDEVLESDGVCEFDLLSIKDRFEPDEWRMIDRL